MPLNKLDNFIKNTEGRILYVSPADLDSTDSIDNQGNSLARPFKTVQRAIIESARFSYVKGSSNDLIEKTTILLMPGEHVIDNRPGFYIKNDGGTAKVVSREGAESVAQSTLDLDLNSNFDITQEDNILYKFNSINGGVIVPRGTSIVGLDLRKTKVRPLYVPNPTDIDVPNSAIFRITGTCYFWQFSFFDGNDGGTVYTDPSDFSVNNKSKPIFSHHKLTCFEYADGVNIVNGYNLTDLDMYYAKLSNAYNTSSGSPDRNIDSKYPLDPDGFAKQRPEWEIVGAFASDPIRISTIEAGSGGTPNNQVTVTTITDHELTSGTPIKINGVSPIDYNISTKVQSVDPSNPRSFTYLLPTFRNNLPTPGTATGATITIETDTVSGASPYIFNISMRSVFGMNGMLADGSKASGFRSMVVAQFTGVSLQKDDRAFVKYSKSSRGYSGIGITKQSGADLSNGSSSINPDQVYHLDSNAVYRQGWEQTHIRITNDAILQIVSVFAIGYNKHFAIESGGDASITNSNSNFGQLSLVSDGFKKAAFAKDNKGFITNIIPPRSSNETSESIDWLSIDVGVTTAVGVSTHLYLRGFESEDDIPPVLTQGYRIGAKVDDRLFVNVGSGTSEAFIYMEDGTTSSFKNYDISASANSKLTVGLNNGLQTGERIILLSDSADYPENIEPHTPYFIISLANSSVTADRDKIQLSSTKTNADNNNSITFFGGSNLRIVSRITEKSAGDAGSPVQFDTTQSRWYITVNSANEIYSSLDTLGVAGIGAETNPTFIKRFPDNRSLDEKVYKFRVVIPKELPNAKTPESGFIIQESSTTGVRDSVDFSLSSIDYNDFEYNKNPRFISTCSHNGDISSVTTELPHNLDVNDQIIITNVKDTNNTVGSGISGYNGTFTVASVSQDNMSFTYSNSTRNPGIFNNNTSSRTLDLPRFERNDLQSNFYNFRNEVISEYIENQRDGIYHIYALKADNKISAEFTELEYSQSVTNLYPQIDRDNVSDNPGSTKSRALSFPIGDVHTSDLKGSITRESADSFMKKLGGGLSVDSAPESGGISTITFTRNHKFAGISTAHLSNVGSGTRSDGTYYNVKLYNEDSYSTWNGATAIVSISSNVISDFQIQSPGSGYSDGNILYFDNGAFAGDNQGQVTLSTSGITTSIGDVVQVTGIATVADAYYRITDVSGVNKISVAKTSGDPSILQGSILLPSGPSISVSSSTFSNEVTTFTCSSAHGLVAGNKFRVTDANNNNLGDHIVKSKVNVNTFTAKTTTQLTSPSFILKHNFSSNAGVSDSNIENLSSRQNTFYAGDTFIINNSGSNIGISTTLIPLSHPRSGAATGVGLTEKLPMGSYIQIDDEIMRVSSTSITGSDELTVLRGVLSSNVGIHSDTSLVKKINIIPVEFRRPSIIRASGHTFEYLGYGPGNYSTGLPQVQTRTLTEKEDFLSQSQERSAGIVVYTGMNNRGDFYIGNTKKSSATGEETSFDTPIPTVAGEDPARLSAIFDEITVKERIVVEGGDSRQILSQFDGPVTFGGEVRIKNSLAVTGRIKASNEEQSNGVGNGAAVFDGGISIGRNVNIGGSMFLPTGDLYLDDNNSVYFGDDEDLQISFNGSHGIINAVTGDIYIQDNGTTRNIFETATAGFVPATDNTGYVGSSAKTFNDGHFTNFQVDSTLNVRGAIDLEDNDVLRFGSSDDLQISFNGSHGIINAVTGDIYIQDNGTSKNIFETSSGGFVPATDNTGYVGSTAKTFASGRFTDFIVDSTLYVRGAIDLADDDVLRFGSNDDVEFFFNGTDFYLDLNSGGNDFIIRDGTTNRFVFDDSGQLRPASDGTGSIGTNTVRWANGYFDALDVTSTLTVRGAIDLADNDILRFGSSDDVEFFFNGTHFYLDLNTGGNDFIIRDGTTNRFVFDDSGIFRPETDGTGSIGTNAIRWGNGYFDALDVTSTLTVDSTLNVRGAIDLADNDVLRFGTSDDLQISFNASHGIINAVTGDIYIQDNGTSKNIFETATAGFVPATDNTGYVGSTAKTFASGRFTDFIVDSTLSVRGAIDLADDDVLRFGSSDDVTISYNANNWLYTNFVTGAGIIFQDNGSNVMRLEDSGIFRPETDGTGAIGTNTVRWANGYFDALAVTSTLTVDSTLNVRGAIDLADDDVLRFGSSDDVTISYNANNWLYTNFVTGNGIVFQDNGSNTMILEDSGIFRPAADGTGEIGTNAVRWANGYFDGLSVTSTLNVRGAIDLADNDILRLGSSDDFQIYHNGTNTYLDNNTNHIVIRNNVDNDDGGNIYIQAKSGENSIICNDDSSVVLYCDNVARFSTSTSGATVTGALSVTGDITAFFTSDERLKDNINLIDNSLEKVISISGNTFDWNDKSNKEGSDTGLIAQEVESLGLPGLVTTRDDGYLAVDYHKVVPLLIEAIKELSNKVDSLEQKLSDK